MNKEQAPHAIVILFPLATLNFEPHFRSYTPRSANPTIIDRGVFTSVCAPRRDRSDTRISYLPTR
jgi:hypothetical protein